MCRCLKFYFWSVFPVQTSLFLFTQRFTRAEKFITMFKPNSGRKVDSSVWSYFKYEPATDKSRCTVILDGGHDSERRACEQQLSGKNATNLRNHLRSKHKTEFAELQSAEQRCKSLEADSRQQKLTVQVCLVSFAFIMGFQGIFYTFAPSLQPCCYGQGQDQGYASRLRLTYSWG